MKTYILRNTYAAIAALFIALFALPQQVWAQEKEAYVVKSTDKTTLTFYYDTQKASRQGTVWGINETQTILNKTYPAWTGYDDSLDGTIRTAVFDASFKEFRPTTTAKWFYNLGELKQIMDIENLNTSEVTDMSGMFRCCALITLDLTKFDTKNVTDMSSMFEYCTRLITLDLTKFDTKNVIYMNSMFLGCAALPDLDITKFDTRKVINMSRMFYECKGLAELDLTNFDTSKVLDMSFMFYRCKALTIIYCNGTWRCDNSKYMFSNCDNLKGAVSYSYNNTDVTMANPETGYFTKESSDPDKEAYVVKNESGTVIAFFYDNRKKQRPGTVFEFSDTQTDDFGSYPAWAGTRQKKNKTVIKAIFNPSFKDFRPTTTAKWFCGLGALKQITGIDYLNTSKVTDMNYMFYDCERLIQLDVTNFDTKNVTNMKAMFGGCMDLLHLDVTNFDTQNVTNMSLMFGGCMRLQQLDVTKFKTQNVTNMSEMFSHCKELKQLDVTNFDTNNVTDMSLMFSFCYDLTQLDVTKFKTQNVTNMSWMFGDCNYLTQIDVTNFDTRKVTNMLCMFNCCYRLTTIYCNDTWSCDKSNDMFYLCEQLKGAIDYDYDKNDVTMANPNTGYFTKKSTQPNKEAYVVKNTDGTTITFYYDTEKASRAGTVWGINQTQTEDSENFPAWTGTRKNSNKTITKSIFDSSFKDFCPQTTAKWFYKLEALTEIVEMENLNTSEVTDMGNMFEGCTSLTSMNNSKSTRAKAPGLINVGLHKSPAAFNVSNFNTANVTNMSYMFAACSSLTMLDLTNFNTEKVTDMRGMFKDCSSLATIYCNDAWTCSNTEDMFKGCVKLKGATEYDANNNNETMMNPDTGYFTKKDPTGIAQTGHAATIKAVYSIDGRRLKETQPGVNIVKMSDGTTRKVVKK